MTPATSDAIAAILRDHLDLHRRTLAELADLKLHILALRDGAAQLGRDDAHIYQLLSRDGARLDALEDRLDPAS